MNNLAYYFFHVAWWLSNNPPGTPVPEWIDLGWPPRTQIINELIDIYEKQTGRKIYERPGT